MNGIYEPTGRAREYSSLAINHYSGCDHGCKYCYCQRLGGRDWKPVAKPEITVGELEQTCKRYMMTRKQVLLSFMGDPYCKGDVEWMLTRKVLLAFEKYRIPCSILTKGGERCMRDLDIFKRFGKSIMVGASITGMDSMEPGAAPNHERIAILGILQMRGVPTWASFEPVIDPVASLALLMLAVRVCDVVKIGKLNNWGDTNGTDWAWFLREAWSICVAAGVKCYVKDDLWEAAGRPSLPQIARNPDAFCAEPWPVNRGEQGGLL